MFVLVNKKEDYVECMTKDKNVFENYFNRLNNKEEYKSLEIPNDAYPIYIVYGKNTKYMNEEEFKKFIISLKQSKENMFGKCCKDVLLFDKENDKDEEDFQQYCIAIKIDNDYIPGDEDKYINHCHICKWELNHLNGDINNLF